MFFTDRVNNRINKVLDELKAQAQGIKETFTLANRDSEQLMKTIEEENPEAFNFGKEMFSLENLTTVNNRRLVALGSLLYCIVNDQSADSSD